MSFVSCIVMMSGIDFVSDAIYVDLKYDDIFVLWVIDVSVWWFVC